MMKNAHHTDTGWQTCSVNRIAKNEPNRHQRHCLIQRSDDGDPSLCWWATGTRQDTPSTAALAGRVCPPLVLLRAANLRAERWETAEKHVLPISGDCLTFDDDSPAHSRVIARRAGASSPGTRHTDAGGQVAGSSLTFAGTANQGNPTRQPSPLVPRVYYDLCNVTPSKRCALRMSHWTYLQSWADDASRRQDAERSAIYVYQASCPSV